MRVASLCLGVLMVAAAPAFAGELTVPSTVTSVTVYPLGAAVTRTARVDLPIGATTVLIDNLPLELDPASLKVDGAADAPLAIASVETRTVSAAGVEDPKRAALQSEIQMLGDKIAAIDGKMNALAGRRRFLEALIKATPGGFGTALGEGKGNVADWAAAATTIGDGLAAVAEAEQALTIEKRALGQQVADRQSALALLPVPEDHLAVRVALEADAAATGTLTLTYQVASARWAPTYDAQLATGDGGGEPALTLVRRAEVTQATGEDWNDVALTLSTARTTEGTAPPALSPFLVSFLEPDLYERDSSATTETRAPAPKALALGGTVAATTPTPARVTEAAADFGDFRAEFHVPGAVSVESGAGARSMRITTDQVPVTLAVKAVPLISDAAYLEASFTPPAGAPLLAGKVALFRDGSFVGNGALPFTEAGKSRDLGFGLDDRVHVTRTTLARETGQRGLLSARKTDLRRYRITVENLHTRPIDIVVLDRMPFRGGRQHRGDAGQRRDRADDRRCPGPARRAGVALHLRGRRKARDRHRL